jgi:hypothetical protein
LATREDQANANRQAGVRWNACHCREGCGIWAGRAVLASMLPRVGVRARQDGRVAGQSRSGGKAAKGTICQGHHECRTEYVRAGRVRANQAGRASLAEKDVKGRARHGRKDRQKEADQAMARPTSPGLPVPSGIPASTACRARPGLPCLSPPCCHMWPRCPALACMH